MCNSLVRWLKCTPYSGIKCFQDMWTACILCKNPRKLETLERTPKTAHMQNVAIYWGIHALCSITAFSWLTFSKQLLREYIISIFYHFEVMDIVPFVLFFKVRWLDFILAASSLPHEDEVWKLRHLRQVEMVTLLAARSALCLKSSLWLKIRYISATRPSAKHGKLFRCSWVNQSPLTDWSLSWALRQVWCSRKLVHKSSNRALCHVHIRHGPQKRTWGMVSQDGISWE